MVNWQILLFPGKVTLRDCMLTHSVPHHLQRCKGHKTTYRSQLFLSTLGFRIEPRSSGLAAGTFTGWAILLSQSLVLGQGLALHLVKRYDPHRLLNLSFFVFFLSFLSFFKFLSCLVNYEFISELAGFVSTWSSFLIEIFIFSSWENASMRMPIRHFLN